jgi:hypothetical protein|tara:strand:- start:388 stop:696 length:309 start_codon:yes stop_codon:yes gene_type:complete
MFRMDHRVVVRSGIDEYLTGVKAAVEGLSPVELYRQPAPNSNHIAWSVWHMAGAEDHWYDRYIEGGEPVWTAEGFRTMLKLPPIAPPAGVLANAPTNRVTVF